MKRNQLAAAIIIAMLLAVFAGCGEVSQEDLVGEAHSSRMRFGDFVIAEAIKSDLVSIDKEGVVEELIDALVEAGMLGHDAKDDVIKALMAREELGSTGIGRGVAVPHTAHPSVGRLVGTVGVSSEGVEFNSLDGQKVHIFVVLLSPPDQPGDQLRALETISRHLRVDAFCRQLRQCNTVDEIRQLLAEADEAE